MFQYQDEPKVTTLFTVHQDSVLIPLGILRTKQCEIECGIWRRDRRAASPALECICVGAVILLHCFL